MRRDVLILSILVVANLVLALPAFDPGLLADNDFVGHWAYATWLVEEAWPAGLGLSGWSPRFNLGAPFLLYNPPPLLYVATAVTVKLTGMSVLSALKMWVVGAFLAVTPLAWALARSVEDEPTDWPLYAALAASLFSGELYGLEFFLKNGMINAACGLPLMMAVWAAFNHAARERGSASVRMVVRGAVLFLLVLLTHLMSAYMACLGILAMIAVHPPHQWGGLFARFLGIVSLGGLLSGAWLLPSLAVAGHDPIVFTWIRGPQGVFDEFVSGRLFSSYSAVFYARLYAVSYVGGLAFVAGAVGTLTAWRRRDRGILGLAAASLLSLWVALGPRAAVLVGALPLYDELLWYRFVTPAVTCWLVVAGYGLWAACTPGPDQWRTSWTAAGVAAIWTLWWFRFAPIGPPVVAGLLVWAALLATRRPRLALWGQRAALAAFALGFALPVLVGRSASIQTDVDFPRDQFELGQIADWLTRNADRRGRLYSEFLNNVPDAISVNHPRHVLPTVTGLDEVAGWIYENNEASRELHRRGLFWFAPFPMITEYATYDVKYVVARSEPFKAALDEDPRWTARVSGRDYALYEAAAYVPSRVEAPPGVTVRRYVEGPSAGGAWRITFDLDGLRGGSDVVVKVNHSTHWSADIDGRPGAVTATEDGLVRLRVPPTTGTARVTLSWSLAPQRRLGRWLSGVGVASLIALVWLAERSIPARATVLAHAAGMAGALAAALWSLVASLGRDPGALSFGLRDGMSPTTSPDTVVVGGWDDTENAALTRVFPQAWGERLLVDGQPGRVPDPDAATHALLVLAPTGNTDLVIDARPVEGRHAIALRVRLVDLRSGESLRTLTARPGVPIPIDGAWLAGHDAQDGVPGATVGLYIGAAEPIVVSRLEVHGPIAFLEGEGLRNDCFDGGRDFRIFVGPENSHPHDGVMITMAVVHDASPIQGSAEVSLTDQPYELWVRLGSVPDAWGDSRAELLFFADDRYVGDATGVGLRRTTGFSLEWEKVGVLRGGPRTRLDVLVGTDHLDVESWADLDLMAFVPIEDGPDTR